MKWFETAYERFIESVRERNDRAGITFRFSRRSKNNVWLDGEQIKGWEIHHVVPKSHGGSNKPSNLVPLTSQEHVTAHALLDLAVLEDPARVKGGTERIGSIGVKPLATARRFVPWMFENPVVVSFNTPTDESELTVSFEDAVKYVCLIENLDPSDDLDFLTIAVRAINSMFRPRKKKQRKMHLASGRGYAKFRFA